MKEHLENLDKARKEFELQGRPPALLEAFLNGDQNRLLSLISHLNLTCRDHYEPAHKPVFTVAYVGSLGASALFSSSLGALSISKRVSNPGYAVFMS